MRHHIHIRTIQILLVLLITALGCLGCTDPTSPPLIASLVPNPVVPKTTPRNLDFLGSNMDPDIYFILHTGAQEIRLDPPQVPGHWTFRCVFGFHYIYTFDSLADFLTSVGSPSQLSIQAFNVGPNLVAENGGGDDLASQPVVWAIDYQ
jgi:hypothetical protein